MPTQPTDRLTMRQAARRFGVSVDRVYKLVRRVPDLSIRVNGAQGGAGWRFLIDPGLLAVALADPSLRVPAARPPGRPPGRPRTRPPAERIAPVAGVVHADR